SCTPARASAASSSTEDCRKKIHKSERFGYLKNRSCGSTDLTTGERLMFTHAFLGSNDIEKSRKFYDATMGVLGYQNVVPPEAGQLVYAGPAGTFIVGKPLNGEAATYANGG